MPDKKNQRSFIPDLSGLFAIGVAGVVCLPILAILYFAFGSDSDVWSHLVKTTLPRYVSNTVFLMIVVSTLAGSMGVGCAYIVAHFDFAGRKWLQWALFLPIAVPAYVSAIVIVEFFDFAGPLQTWLRDVFGWQTGQDYWFPEIRSRLGAAFVLSFALFPYVYVLARSAFNMQSASHFDAARILGKGPLLRLFHVAIPLARPAIVAGIAIVLMETVSDFGTVDLFSVQTLTTGIFTTWFQANDIAGAAQIATLILLIVVLISGTERFSRARARYSASGQSRQPLRRQALRGWRSWLASMATVIPFFGGFVFPVILLVWYALHTTEVYPAKLVGAIVNSVVLGGLTAALICGASLAVVIGAYRSRWGLTLKVLPLTMIGYAAPGAVLAIGLLYPVAKVEHLIADGIEALLGIEVGLLITSSIGLLLLAYFIRFFAIGAGAVESAFLAIPSQLESTARTLGDTKRRSFLRIQVPLSAKALGSASLLIFVDVIKELPATLILRPFGFENLASFVYERASLEDVEAAAAGGIVIVFVGLFAVIVLASLNSTRTQKTN